MNRIFCSLVFLATSMLLHAQEPTPILLWPEGAPGALGKEEKDIPTITPYLPTDPTIASGAAMVILPGGGYGALAPHEGKGYADWLVTNGVASFVVKYRLGFIGWRPSRFHVADALRFRQSRRAGSDRA